MGNITYEAERNRLVQTSMSELRKEPYREYLQLDQPIEQTEESR